MIARPVFKEWKLVWEWATLNPTARVLAEWCSIYIWSRILGQSYMTITEVWYPGRSGIHEQWRAFDVSARDAHTGELLPDDICLEAEREINRAWIYDEERPLMKCCLYHKVRRGEFHFHLQVHPNTAYKGAAWKR